MTEFWNDFIVLLKFDRVLNKFFISTTTVRHWKSFEQLFLVLLQVNIYRCSSWQVFLVLLRLLILTDFQTNFLLVLLLTSIEFWTAIYVQFTIIRHWTSFELFLVLLMLNFDRVFNDFSIALLLLAFDSFLFLLLTEL